MDDPGAQLAGQHHHFVLQFVEFEGFRGRHGGVFLRTGRDLCVGKIGRLQITDRPLVAQCGAHFVHEGVSEEWVFEWLTQINNCIAVGNRVTLLPGWNGGDPTKVVRCAYQDILPREPDESGLRSFRSRMIDQGWTEQMVRDALRRSAEYRNRPRTQEPPKERPTGGRSGHQR